MNHDLNDPPSIALLPSSLQPAFDASTDRVLEAIRAECLDVLQKPLDVATLRTVTALLDHASGIVQLRRGAPAMRGRKRRNINLEYPGDFGDGEDGPIVSAPPTETAGTHAVREIVGLMGRLTDSLSTSTQKPKGHEDALAAESLVRALVNSQNLPDDVRPAIQAQLREKLAAAMGEPAPSEPFANGPRSIVEAAQ